MIYTEGWHAGFEAPPLLQSPAAERGQKGFLCADDIGKEDDKRRVFGCQMIAGRQ